MATIVLSMYRQRITNKSKQKSVQYNKNFLSKKKLYWIISYSRATNPFSSSSIFFPFSSLFFLYPSMLVYRFWRGEGKRNEEELIKRNETMNKRIWWRDIRGDENDKNRKTKRRRMRMTKEARRKMIKENEKENAISQITIISDNSIIR